MLSLTSFSGARGFRVCVALTFLQETVPNFLMRLAHEKAHNFLQTKHSSLCTGLEKRCSTYLIGEKGFLRVN